jgi:pSer/pThr/pTyr-binding forkhead associated (FHA) protein/outer membrane biosynthesis protein TonB
MGVALSVQAYKAGQMIGQYSFDSDQLRAIKIGRLTSAQIKLEDAAVARIHAVIEFAGTDASVVDMGSTAGTLVNGAKIHKVKLNHGDQITVGETVLVVAFGGAPAMAAPPMAAAPMAAPQQMMPGGPMPGMMPGMGQPMGGMAPPGIPPMSPMAGVPAPGMAGSPRGMPGAQQQWGQPMPGAMPVDPNAGMHAQAGVPRFDGGVQAPAQVQRITKERLASAAVESKPHPSLPPEPPLTNENRVLEMRIYWGEVLLAMHHYIKPKRITIGENRKTNFFISSEGLPVEEFPIIRYQDDEYTLAFCQGMDGEVEIEGNLQSLAALRGSSVARKDEIEGTYNLKLPMTARALLHWGGATIALRFVPPTTPVKTTFSQNIDIQYVNMLLVSIFFHLAGITTLVVYPHDADALRVDLFDEPDRFAQLVLEAPQENKSTADLLEKLKKNVEEKKVEIEKKVEKKVEEVKLTKVNVPQNVPKPQKTQEQRKQEVAAKFQKLFSGTGASGGGAGSLLGGGGGGSLAGTLSNVIGTAGAGSAGAGIAGLGIRGTGPMTGGGIGTSRGIAGIGTSGRLGGGGMAYGSGVGLGAKKDSSMISLSTPVVMGALPPEVIKKVIDENKNQIRYCYESELQRNQNLEGRVMMTWVIAATGAVAKTSVKESTLKNDNVERCIGAKIRGWRFPPPAGGGIVEVNYPFVFRAG